MSYANIRESTMLRTALQPGTKPNHHDQPYSPKHWTRKTDPCLDDLQFTPRLPSRAQA